MEDIHLTPEEAEALRQRVETERHVAWLEAYTEWEQLREAQHQPGFTPHQAARLRALYQETQRLRPTERTQSGARVTVGGTDLRR